jgi:hypothetical protein
VPLKKTYTLLQTIMNDQVRKDRSVYFQRSSMTRDRQQANIPVWPHCPWGMVKMPNHNNCRSNGVTQSRLMYKNIAHLKLLSHYCKRLVLDSQDFWKLQGFRQLSFACEIHNVWLIEEAMIIHPSNAMGLVCLEIEELFLLRVLVRLKIKYKAPR